MVNRKPVGLRPQLLDIAHPHLRAREACVSRPQPSQPTNRPTWNAQLRVLLTLVLALLGAARLEGAGITVDATSSYNASTFVSSISWSHTVNSQSYRMLIVAVGAEKQSGAATEPSSWA